jgi:ATP synthase protein I
VAGEHEPAPDGSGELGRRIGSRERRKVRARRSPDRTLWHGLGTAGIIGWSIAVPTVIGALLGLWLDRRWPGEVSWTLALLLAGVSLGCLNAWYWVSMESRMIEKDEAEEETAR